MAYDSNNQYNQTQVSDQFPGSGNDLGLWTTRGLAKVPVVTRHGMTALDPNSPAAFRFASEGLSEQTEDFETTLQRFGDLSPGELAGLSTALFSAGTFYDDKFYGKNPPAVSDEDTFNAYKRAVTQAARHHQTVAEVIQGAIGEQQKRGGVGSGGRTREPLSIQLTNPTDIHAVGNKIGQTILGRNLNTGELDAITKAFQAQESSSQRAAYNANVGGGTTTAAPNLSTFAEAQVKAQNPLEAAGHGVASTFDTFLGLLSGGGK